MKTRADLETHLRAELNQWFVKQCQDGFTDYYLWFLESTAEHDGGILIAAKPPANTGYRLALPEKIRKGCTVEQNFNWLRLGICRTLPVLSVL